MSPAAFALMSLALMGCASVQSVVEVTGTPGAPGRSTLPVYYGLSPGFPTQEVGVIDSYGRGPTAHLDELLADAEARARRLGADAVLVRGVRTVARYTTRTEYRPCSRGLSMRMTGGFTCPVQVSSLEVDMHLRVAAVRRGESVAAPPPWRAVPSLAPAPWGAAPAGGSDAR